MGDEFAGFLRRLRAGDPQAAQELVQEYETELRIVARARLRDPRMRRLVDSVDLTQSVFGNFFVRTAAGQFELETREDLLQLLAQMVRNKAIDHVRRQQAGKRDVGQMEQAPVEEHRVAGGDQTPSQVVSFRELLDQFEERLSDEIRPVSQLRREGHTWEEIGERLGQNGLTLRKRFEKEIGRVAHQLRLDE